MRVRVSPGPNFLESIVKMHSSPISRDKSLKLFPNSYVVLDIETTGFNPKEHEIIELSALKAENGVIIDEFSKLVKPVGYLSSYISNLTGITIDMLQNASFIKETILDFKEFCANYIVIGHNINFDLSFINTQLIKNYDIPFTNDYIDTLKLARKYLPQLPSRKLGAIAEYFGLDTTGMHRGLKDCMVTNLCYQKFIQMHSPEQHNQINALGLKF